MDTPKAKALRMKMREEKKGEMRAKKSPEMKSKSRNIKKALKEMC